MCRVDGAVRVVCTVRVVRTVRVVWTVSVVWTVRVVLYVTYSEQCGRDRPFNEFRTNDHSHFQNIFAIATNTYFVGMGAGGGLAISTFARW
jgi:hypothetical protein